MKVVTEMTVEIFQIDSKLSASKNEVHERETEGSDTNDNMI